MLLVHSLTACTVIKGFKIQMRKRALFIYNYTTVRQVALVYKIDIKDYTVKLGAYQHPHLIAILLKLYYIRYFKNKSTCQTDIKIFFKAKNYTFKIFTDISNRKISLKMFKNLNSYIQIITVKNCTNINPTIMI